MFDSRFILAPGVVTFGMLLGACGGSATSPTASSPVPPLPVSPSNNAVIAQNNPASGCPPRISDPALGSGASVEYRWGASSLPTGVAGYELYAIHVGSPTPLIDTVVPTTQYTETICDGVIADFNLTNWQWRVRAKDTQGQFTDWSAWATFQFASCRLSDGTPCHGGN